jgi:hypothetical protein
MEGFGFVQGYVVFRTSRISGKEKHVGEHFLVRSTYICIFVIQEKNQMLFGADGKPRGVPLLL